MPLACGDFVCGTRKRFLCWLLSQPQDQRGITRVGVAQKDAGTKWALAKQGNFCFILAIQSHEPPLHFTFS